MGQGWHKPSCIASYWESPTERHFGMSVAVGMMLKSTRHGKHDKSYTQFETMKKLRAAYTNLCHALMDSETSSMTLGRDKAKSF